MTTDNLHIQYEGENIVIEIIAAGDDIQYKINFEHPVYLEKDVDDAGEPFWFEVGAGQTLRSKEIGEQIENHPDFM